MILILLLILVFLVVDNLYLIAFASEDVASLFLGFDFGQLPLHFKLCESLFLNSVNVVVEILRNDDVPQIGNQIRVNPDHFDEVRVAGAQNVNDFDAEGFYIECLANGANVKENLEPVFFDELLGEKGRDLGLLGIHKDQAKELEHLQLKAWASLRVGKR